MADFYLVPRGMVCAIKHGIIVLEEVHLLALTRRRWGIDSLTVRDHVVSDHVAREPYH